MLIVWTVATFSGGAGDVYVNPQCLYTENKCTQSASLKVHSRYLLVLLQVIPIVSEHLCIILNGGYSCSGFPID